LPPAVLGRLSIISAHTLLSSPIASTSKLHSRFTVRVARRGFDGSDGLLGNHPLIKGGVYGLIEGATKAGIDEARYHSRQTVRLPI
jgi:hypothetical protein